MMTRGWRLGVLSLLLAATQGCSDGNDNAPDGGVDLDAGPTCTDADQSVTVMVSDVEIGPGLFQLAAWNLSARLTPTSVLAYQGDETGVQRIAVLEPTGITEIATIPDASSLPLRAASVPNSSCAVLHGAMNLSYFCPGESLEGSSFDLNWDAPLYPVQTSGSLFLYTQNFAAFTELERTGPGRWVEHEQFESSISYPTDATLAGDRPIACFIDIDDRAVVTYAGSRHHTTEAARWCKLAVDGDTVHILTDIGYTTRSLSSLTGEGSFEVTATTLTERPDRLLVLDGAPYILLRSVETIDLWPVTTGEPIHVPRPEGSMLLADWDASARALTVISADAERTGSGPEHPQTIRFQTHCID